MVWQAYHKGIANTPSAGTISTDVGTRSRITGLIVLHDPDASDKKVALCVFGALRHANRAELPETVDNGTFRAEALYEDGSSPDLILNANPSLYCSAEGADQGNWDIWNVTNGRFEQIVQPRGTTINPSLYNNSTYWLNVDDSKVLAQVNFWWRPD